MNKQTFANSLKITKENTKPITLHSTKDKYNNKNK